ncbi:hypothetical protein [Paenibacillus sp. 598K]|uniref:hypothetical protein n=1 Tax=Paenibacillus sp. 598K TaxID=1117987 RepID=UPI000FFE45C6|nr:hypothetical protein [Paenibacillus sp. 598K]
MIALLSFLHTCFMRSYRYGPPTVVFLLGIVFVYSVVPNPVMDSYAFSTVFLFIISTALCYMVIDIETPNQESVTMLHSGSIIKLYFAKLLYSWLFTFPLALYAVLYPAVLQRFDRNPSIEELSMSFLYHVASSWLGVALACWFGSKVIRSRIVSFILLSVLVVIAIAAQGIENLLPDGIKKAALLLPPLNHTIHVFVNFELATLFEKVSVIGFSLVYGAILTALFLFLLHKRKLDSAQV